MLLEPRTTDGADDRLPSAAVELVAQGPDLIVVQTVPATRALMQATKSIPIVMVGVGNPVELGLVAGKGDFEAAFGAIRSANTQSILLPPEPLIQSSREAIAGFAQTHGLALAVVGASRALPASGLIAYGPAREEYAQLAARYVDRILKGTRPGDLSVEQTTRFNLVINLKTAKALGLTLPQSLMLRADVVIQ